MNILGVQIVSVLFAVFMLYVAFLHWKRKDLGNTEYMFWFILWCGFIAVTLFPNSLQNLTNLLFFARVMDLLMIGAFMVLAYIGFNNYISNKKMEKKIENLTRKDAIKNYKPPRKVK
jgi:hypothetical protein